MDFRGNTFAVQGQGAYMLLLEQKIHGKTFNYIRIQAAKNASLHENMQLTTCIWMILQV